MNSIDIWLAYYQEFADEPLLARWTALLSEDERRQHTRFYFADDRLRYLWTRAMVRTVLSRYAAVDPMDWAFAANAYGRPAIANLHPDTLTLRFNVSHTRGLIALAVSREREVGVDVENVVERRGATGIADRFFSPLEAAELARQPEARRPDRFFEYWTFKEAYIKARGMGLSLPLDKFSFHFPREDTVRIAIDPELADDERRWSFWQFRPAPQHLLALCADRAGAQAPEVTLRKVVPTVGHEVLETLVCRSSRQGFWLRA